MVFGEVGNWMVHFIGEPWETAFEFLADLNPDAPEGYTQLTGDLMYARVMSYETTTSDHARIEAHRNYIDIQASIENAERIAWFPLGVLEELDEYNPEKDVIHFQPTEMDFGSVVVHPGTFAVFFPEDAHMPKLITHSSQLVKKVVIKVSVDLLSIRNRK